MDKMECSESKILKLQNKIKEIEKLKSIYCYSKEKMDREYCIKLSYDKWLLNLEYLKYYRNNKS